VRAHFGDKISSYTIPLFSRLFPRTGLRLHPAKFSCVYSSRIRFRASYFPFIFQIVPSYRSAPPPCDIFMGAQFADKILSYTIPLVLRLCHGIGLRLHLAKFLCVHISRIRFRAAFPLFFRLFPRTGLRLHPATFSCAHSSRIRFRATLPLFVLDCSLVPVCASTLRHFVRAHFADKNRTILSLYFPDCSLVPVCASTLATSFCACTFRG
jgi:hypothetical protein